MKFFIIFALCVAAASARFIIPDVAAAEAAEIEEILAAINNPSTDPATAAALQQLLNDFFGIEDSPIHVGPAIVGPVVVDESPIAPGPVIVDEIEQSPIHVGPAIIDEADLVDVVDVGPAIIDQPAPSSSPLVQIVINVNSGASVIESPVVVEPTPIIEPTPVIVVDSPEDVEVVEKPIINIPVFPSPGVVPDTLN